MSNGAYAEQLALRIYDYNDIHVVAEILEKNGYRVKLRNMAMPGNDGIVCLLLNYREGEKVDRQVYGTGSAEREGEAKVCQQVC